MRLDKFLAHAGIGTRREAHVILRAARVTVNGSIERDGASHISQGDQIAVDGKTIQLPGPLIVAFHKPAGLVTSTKDAQATIYTVLSLDPEKVKPIGRLDKETEGLLLLTDDGDLNHQLCSPRHHVEKEYVAELDHEIGKKTLEKLKQSVTLENGEKARAAIEVEKLGPKVIRLVIDEGKYHQVRRMCAAIGFRVVHLKRIRVGSISLGNLKPGEHRALTTEEGILLRSQSRKPKRV